VALELEELLELVTLELESELVVEVSFEVVLSLLPKKLPGV